MLLHTFPRLLFLYIFFTLAASAGFAQRKNDVIIKRDSSRIQALITQMSYEKINYRDLATADSARKYISLDDVARVLLKNGRTINVRDSVLATHTPPDSIGQYADMDNLPTDPFEKSVVMANSDQLRDKYKYHHNRAIDGRNGLIIFTSLGAASLVSGLVVASHNGSPDNKKIGIPIAVAGPITGGVIALIALRNYRFHAVRAKKVKHELERRNQPLTSLRLVPAFDPFNKSAQLTIRMSL